MRARSARQLQPGQRIRVLVVDDSVVIRRLVCHVLEEDPALEVAGVAVNGRMALNRIPQVNPDLITLDIEMPEMDGLEMLRELRRENQSLPVVMFSTMTERGASATLEALSLGADDYVTKASNAGSLDVSLANLRQQLLPKIRQFFRTAGLPAGLQVPVGTLAGLPAGLPVPVGTQVGLPAGLPVPAGMQVVLPPAASVPTPASPAPIRAPSRPVSRIPARAVAIGVSTGGPAALAEVVRKFPVDFRVPIFVVQHMPPLFTRLLAERLNTLTPLAVAEARDGEKPVAGHIYLAPGDQHMRVVNSPTGPLLALDQAAPMNSCLPVDALFSSLAEVYGPAVVAAVLTGMGHDGRLGAERLAARGAHILAQDEATSVVWGMPGAVVDAGVANEVLPLEGIVPAILRKVQGV